MKSLQKYYAAKKHIPDLQTQLVIYELTARQSTPINDYYLVNHKYNFIGIPDCY